MSVALLLACGPATLAQQDSQFPSHVPFDKNELDIWKHDQILGRTDDIRNGIIAFDDSAMALRDAQCRVAIGHKEFCGCLNEFLPLRIDFKTYVNFCLGIEITKQNDGKTTYAYDKSLKLSPEEERGTFAAMITCQTVFSQSAKPSRK